MIHGLAVVKGYTGGGLPIWMDIQIAAANKTFELAARICGAGGRVVDPPPPNRNDHSTSSWT